jgi:hypothetical protein
MKKLYIIFIVFLILGLQSCDSKKQKINFTKNKYIKNFFIRTILHTFVEILRI